MAEEGELRGCPACGLVQRLPDAQQRYQCTRCGHALWRHAWSSAPLTAALALSGLIIYPFAITLPVLRIERFGHRYESGILDGTISLIAHGEWVVGLVVLIASVILPAFKLGGLLVLSLLANWLRPHWRASTWHAVELTGRWGMLDVLLVAVLVAMVKIGGLVEMHAGPGVIAFTLLVILSLLSAMAFDPHHLWRGARNER